MDDQTDGLLEKVRQYQNSINKHSQLGNDTKILHYIGKLYDMPVTVAHLQETGIGRTINSLRKYSGDVGHASRAIVSKWKNMVAQEEEEIKNDDENCSDEDYSPYESPPEERKKERNENRHISSKKYESNEKINRKSESSSHDKPNKLRHEDNSERSKSHHRKEEKRNSSQKSSHKEKDRDKESSSHHRKSDKYRKDDKHRSDKKRKHDDDSPSLSKKKKYDTTSSGEDDDDSDDESRLLIHNGEDSSQNEDEYMSDNDNCLPDSTTDNNKEEQYIEDICSDRDREQKSSSKKHHKSDKHRSKDKEKEHHHSSSSKKSSHRDKESKHSSSSTSEKKKEKNNTSNSSSNSNHASTNSNSHSTSSKKANDKDAKASSSSSKRNSDTKKVNKGILLDADDGIDSGSGASFAEALGMIGPIKNSNKVTNKKKIIGTNSVSPSPSTSSSSITPKSPIKTPKTLTPKPSSPLAQQSPNLLSPTMKLEPLDMNITAQLPEITTNYKPMNNYSVDSPPSNNFRHMSEEEALSVVITSKTQRTKVYSGNKTNWGYVPTLFNLCVRVLQDNIDALEYTGGVPYEILKPVLERATANQLLNAEYHNPYLIEDTDELWGLHCKRECRGMKRQEMESWREMYMRCRDERDAKLKALTVNIKQSIDKSLPVRQTKLAYVDSVVKPPRGIARKQAKYGTDKPVMTPSARLNSLACGSNAEKVPDPGRRAMTSSSSASVAKPKKAPLMQKTLALIKSRFRR